MIGVWELFDEDGYCMASKSTVQDALSTAEVMFFLGMPSVYIKWRACVA